MANRMTTGEHPLQSFRYCPQCGRESFDNLGQRAKRCSACGLTYYHNVASAVALFVRDATGRYLFVRRALEPAKGTLDLAGGFVDPHESAEEAVERELLEETGLKPLSLRYLGSSYNIYPYSGIDIYTNDLIFLVEVADISAARAMDDAGEVVLARLEELSAQDFGLQSIRALVAEALGRSARLAPLYE